MLASPRAGVHAGERFLSANPAASSCFARFLLASTVCSRLRFSARGSRGEEATSSTCTPERARLIGKGRGAARKPLLILFLASEAALGPFGAWICRLASLASFSVGAQPGLERLLEAFDD